MSLGRGEVERRYVDAVAAAARRIERAGGAPPDHPREPVRVVATYRVGERGLRRDHTEIFAGGHAPVRYTPRSVRDRTWALSGVRADSYSGFERSRASHAAT